ncbi:MAG: DUF89 domain-containing protein [Candidatus Hodarchaeota archaeon]
MRDSFIRAYCGECFIKTAMRFLNEGTNDGKKIFKGLKRTLEILNDEFTENAYTFIIGNKLAREINKVLEDDTLDIFKDVKRRSNELCMSMYPDLEQKYDLLDDLDSKLEFVKTASVAGNIIDVGTPGHEFKLDSSEMFNIMDEIKEEGFIINDTDKLKDLILDPGVKKFLIMLDNAGEIVFDKFLLKLLKENEKSLTCMVRGKPIANDATLDDASLVGITEICDEVLETSIASLGYTIPDNEQDVIEKVNNMDVIIGKGQANLETLSIYADEIEAGHIFVLSRIKCETVAEFMGVKIGDNMLKKVK